MESEFSYTMHEIVLRAPLSGFTARDRLRIVESILRQAHFDGLHEDKGFADAAEYVVNALRGAIK